MVFACKKRRGEAMKTLNVLPILKELKPILKEELEKQEVTPIFYSIKSTRTGRIKIEIVVQKLHTSVKGI